MQIKKLVTHPFLGMLPARITILLKDNGFRPDIPTLIKISYIYFSALPATLLALAETAIYSKRVNATKITEAPIFIIGHWRSGTTFLHYMMSADKNMGYINNRQAFMPRAMLVASKLTSRLTAMHMMKKRPMDDVELTPDSPQEEEFALMHYGIGSYLGCAFPKRIKYYFLKYADLENCSEKERSMFKKHYYNLAKKISFANNNKRLLLKNPVSTVRIKTLLELFPNAKFIYLHRSPYDVYNSTLRLYEKMTEQFTLQEYKLEEITSAVPDIYKFFQQKYEADKKLIPASQLIEISYEQMMQEPLNTVESIYNHLQIPGFADAKQDFISFLNTQKEYKPANYQLTEESKNQIDRMLNLNG